MKKNEDVQNAIRVGILFFRRYIWIIVPTIFLFGYLFMRLASLMTDFHQIDRKNYHELSIDSLNDRVSSNYENRGLSYITFENNKRVWLPYSENLNYKPHLLCRFVRPGDILVRAKNNDTIIILRDDAKYFFKLGKKIR